MPTRDLPGLREINVALGGSLHQAIQGAAGA